MLTLSTPRNSCLYKVAGTDTLRLSSSKLPNKTGTNLQNIEKSMRALYIPDDGKIFVQTDQSGAEALVVAYLCRHGAFRDLFLNGIKSHVFVAMHVFAAEWQKRLTSEGLDIKFDISPFLRASPAEIVRLPFWKELKDIISESDNWPAKERYYYIAKMICHASNYGMKAGAFQINVLEKSRGKIVLSKQEAEYYLSTYHKLFPEIHEWHREVEEMLHKTRTLYNLFGYPRKFTGNLDENNIKSAYAFIPQSTVGCITNIAFTRLQNYIEDTPSARSWDLLANTHDSYMGQCMVGEEREFGAKQKEFIGIELTNFRGEKFRMKSETQCGYNWAPANPKKNPRGLVEMKGL